MIFLRQQIEEREKAGLAPYAVKSGESQGRVFLQKEDDYRTCFQRDRDRIIHCKAFRRLQEKTQVFVATEGDHYRNRMIHSVECAQISRGLARGLGLNEDLCEAVALAHDLGHPPFGHAGEHAMNEVMHGFGLHFEHNEQSLRIVEHFEKVFPDFDGLNLTKEVLDGLLKHHTPYDRPKMVFTFSAHLEGQVVDLADEIAYTSADIDDGLRSGMFSVEEVDEIPLLREILGGIDRVALARSPAADELVRQQLSSKLLNRMVMNVFETSQENLAKAQIATLADVQAYNGILVRFSDDFRAKLDMVRGFLMRRFYYSPKVQAQTDHGQNIIRGLFSLYMNRSELLPEKFQKMIAAGERTEIVIKDYIAGMTDHFAEEAFAQNSGSRFA
jgi:dGTPase